MTDPGAPQIAPGPDGVENDMPIYEYECPACGHRFESLHGLAEPTPACPHCQADVRQLISVPVVHGERARGREEAMRSLRSATAPGCGCGPPGHRH